MRMGGKVGSEYTKNKHGHARAAAHAVVSVLTRVETGETLATVLSQ